MHLNINVSPYPLGFTQRRAELNIANRVNIGIRTNLQNWKQEYKQFNYIPREEAPLFLNSTLLNVKDLLPLKEKEFASGITDKLVSYFNNELEETNNNLNYDKIVMIIRKWVEDIDLQNPEVIKLNPLIFDQNDFSNAQMNFAKYQDSSRIPQCYDYAFYMLNEEQAFPYIFNEIPGKWPSDFVNKPIFFLQNWGYQVITKPSPDDLVVYCIFENNVSVAKHWGIWGPNHKVISKHGNAGIYEHPIDDVITVYGDHVYFFRKTVKTFYEKSCLKEIEKATLSIHDFSHPACLSPLNGRECLEKMAEIFNQIPFEYVLSKSLYNQEYNEKVKLTLLNKIKKIQTDCPKIQVLNKLKAILSQRNK